MQSYLFIGGNQDGRNINCHDEFPDEEMNYDPRVRDGAPVCNKCYETLTGLK